MRIIPLIICMFLGLIALESYAGCSDAAGKATINEVYKLTTGTGTASFVEIKIIDETLTSAVYEEWTVQICDGGGCVIYNVSDFTDSFPWLYIQAPTLDDDYLDFKNGFDITLRGDTTDNGGADSQEVIDYVVTENFFEQDLDGCSTDDLPYWFGSQNTNNGTKLAKRISDGTGGWEIVNDNDESETPGSSNDGEADTGDNIAKYQLEESIWGGSGSILDSSGNNNHASPVGDIMSTIDNPISCQAADIPYNNNLATRDAINTDVNANTLGDKGSIAFWYRSDSKWNNISKAKVLFDASTSSDAQFLMYIWPGGYLEFEATEPNGDRAERYIKKSFSADEWVHIALTWDAINDEVKIYLNGVSQSLSDQTGKSLLDGLHPSMGALYFGDNNSTTASALGGSADGVLDEIHLFNYVLSSAEVSAVKDDVTACAPPVVHHYEIVHEGEGTTCAAAPVTIKACTNSDCSILVSSGVVNLDFQVNGVTKSSPSFIGSSSFTFNHDTEETITLSIANSSATPDNPLVCDDGSGNSCDMVISACDNACAAYFPDTIQGHDTSAYLKFKETGQLLGDADNIATFPTLTDDTSASHNTCGTQDCTVSGTTAPAFDLPTFETTSATNDIVLTSGTVTIGAGGDYAVSEIRTLTLGDKTDKAAGNANVTFLSTGETFKIDDGFFAGDSIITFNTGTYWFNELEITGSAQVIINGPVTILVNGQSNHFDIEQNAKINVGGAAQNLAIVSWKDLHLKNDVQANAVLYSEKNVDIKDQVKHTGAISVFGKLEIKKTASVTYEDVSGVQVSPICGDLEPSIHHYEIVHDGQGLTCAPEPVIIKACIDNVCSSLSTDSVSLDFQANGSTKSSPTFTGSTSFDFNHTIAETLTLSIANATIAASEPIVCDDGSGSSCDIDFVDAGFIFSQTSVVNEDIDNQIAGTPFTAYIRAVENVDGVCTGLFNGDVTVGLSQKNIAPTTPDGLNFTVKDTHSNTKTLGKHTTYTDVELEFNGSSEATLTNATYLDAGQIQLYASYSVDGVNLVGSSNIFWVSPFKLVARAQSEGSDIDGSTNTSEIIHEAGQVFDFTVTAYNSLGTEDENKTINYTPNNMQLLLTRTGPSPDGFDGTFNYGTGAIFSAISPVYQPVTLSAFFEGVSSTNSATFSEVGLLNLDLQDVDYGFLGNVIAGGSITGDSLNIGRFYPDHFDVLITSNSFEDVCTSGATDFTYIGQSFSYLNEPELIITAKNYSGITTRNYTEEDYQKLEASDISRTFPAADTTRDGADNATKMVVSPLVTNGTLTSPVTSPTSSVGVMTYTFNDTDSFTYDKDANSLIASFTTIYDILIDSIQDADGANAIASLTSNIPSSNTVSPTGTNLVFGRWIIENTFGSERTDLPFPMAVQYYDGTSFITNPIDTCTAYDGDNAANHSLSITNLNNPLSATNLTPISGNGVFSLGLAELQIGKPTDGSQGQIRLTYDATPTWLKYDWTWNGVDAKEFNENPSAVATFGLFRGNDRIIYQREVNN